MNHDGSYKLRIDIINLPLEILSTGEGTLLDQPSSTIRLRFLLKDILSICWYIQSLLQHVEFGHSFLDILLHRSISNTQSSHTHSSDPSAHNSPSENQSFRISASSLRPTEILPSSLVDHSHRITYDCRDHSATSCASQLPSRIPSV